MKIPVYGGPADGAHVVIPETMASHGFIIAIPVKTPAQEFRLPIVMTPHVRQIAYIVIWKRGESPKLVFLPIARKD